MWFYLLQILLRFEIKHQWNQLSICSVTVLLSRLCRVLRAIIRHFWSGEFVQSPHCPFSWWQVEIPLHSAQLSACSLTLFPVLSHLFCLIFTDLYSCSKFKFDPLSFTDLVLIKIHLILVTFHPRRLECFLPKKSYRCRSFWLLGSAFWADCCGQGFVAKMWLNFA